MATMVALPLLDIQYFGSLQTTTLVALTACKPLTMMDQDPTRSMASMLELRTTSNCKPQMLLEIVPTQ
jgi:hypothetical protein